MCLGEDCSLDLGKLLSGPGRAEALPGRGEVLVQDAEGDVGQQRGEDASLGVPVMVS
jgi:hypothetical protein